MATATCYEKAIELLARRAHFRLELVRKLEARDYSPEDIEHTVTRLEAAGHLDEQATAEQYVAGRLRRGGLGPRRLLAELHQRGVDGEVARAVVGEGVDDESELARAAVERWRRGRSPQRATVQALARHLERAGFAASVVAEQLRIARAEEAETD